MSSSLRQERLKFSPKLPKILLSGGEFVSLAASVLSPEIEEEFPLTSKQPTLRWEPGQEKTGDRLRVGVLFSGGQAAGGHNVIAGLYDAMTRMHRDSQLLGFLGGPSGLISASYTPITAEMLAGYRNQGGFDLIGSGRTKIETVEDLAAAGNVARELELDGLVIIGGDDSNTNAAVLAEYYLSRGIKTKVIGVPKTIDGDLKNDQIEVSFGFDSATKVFSEAIGNILRDSLSAKKYYFFIKLMGRSASHVTLECALQTHPNMALIGEEVLEKGSTFRDLVIMISDMVCLRAAHGKHYGTVLVPEGLIECVPASSLNDLPPELGHQLHIEKDPHGNIQVSKIETERLLVLAVSRELEERRVRGEYNGAFNAQPLFFGYEGRSCYPSNFDANYCYGLGYLAARLINAGATGYLCCLQGLANRVENWTPLALPLTSLLHFEVRKGKRKPVIRKALVDLGGPVFQEFSASRKGWLLEDDYSYPGPMQFFGPEALTDTVSITLQLESKIRNFSLAQ